MDATNGIEAALRTSEALQQGHFQLSSGRHSDQYIEKFNLLRQPVLTSQVCALIADRFRHRNVDVVAGPTTGGVILAFEVARQLGSLAAYAERSEVGDSKREFRRGTTFSHGARVLIVDDILTTGGSIRETLSALHEEGIEAIGVAVLVDRSDGAVDFGIPIDALLHMTVANWEPSDCPLCAAGEPLTKPGTTRIAGRSE